MRKRLLTFYDKIILASLVGVLGLFGCCRKTYPEKKKQPVESKVDTIQQVDTFKIIKEKFDNRAIAMYGVRPTENVD